MTPFRQVPRGATASLYWEGVQLGHVCHLGGGVLLKAHTFVRKALLAVEARAFPIS